MSPSTKTSTTIRKAALPAALSAALLAVGALPAYAHVGAGATSSFAAGLGHPFSGFDHMAVMIAVGLWAAIKGGKAIWAWPAAFVGVMLLGGVLGMLQVPVPFVEPGIAASVVALGLLVALAVDLPVSAGAAVIGLFALFHGHAHGTEVPVQAAGLDYLAGFALATLGLHLVGILAGLGLGTRLRGLVRASGLAVSAVGAGLVLGMI
jgi:urease accessory protein